MVHSIKLKNHMNNNKINLIKKAKVDLSQQSLEQGFSYDEENNEIKYIWSKDPDHIRDYTKLIDLYYENELNLVDTYKNISPNDMNSYFLIVLHKNEVISGARLTVNIPDSKTSLPNEKLGFSYHTIFPELDLEHSRYCEISRYTMHINYRKMNSHYINAFRMFYELTLKLGVKYMFICSDKPRLRLYSVFSKKYFALKDTKFFGVRELDPTFEYECSFACYENKDVK